MGSTIGDFITANITRETGRVLQTGFGTPMLLGEHPFTKNRIDKYKTPQAMLNDGFPVTSQLYKMAVAMMSQRVSPRNFLVGRKLGNFNAIQTIAIAGTATAGTYTITLDNQTTAAIQLDDDDSAVEAALELLSNITSVSVTGTLATGFVIEFDGADANTAFNDFVVDISSLTGATGVTVTVNQTGSTVQTWTEALADVRSKPVSGSEADNFFSLMIASNIKADILEIAALIEPLTKMFFPLSMDADIPQTGSADLMSLLKGLTYDHTSLMFTRLITITYGTLSAGNGFSAGEVVTGAGGATGTVASIDTALSQIKILPTNSTDYILLENVTGGTTGSIAPISDIVKNQIEAAWNGRLLPEAPGSANWHKQQLKAVTTDDYTTNELSELTSKRANFFESVASLNLITSDGITASGEFNDVIRGLLWIQTRITEVVFALLANEQQSKIPFTQNGIDSIVQRVSSFLVTAENAGVLVAGSSSVQGPAIEDISDGDKLTRILNGITFSGQLQGAINRVNFEGSVDV